MPNQIETAVFISPLLQGVASVLDLIQPDRLLMTAFHGESGEGMLFGVKAPGYSLVCGVREGHLLLERNGTVVKAALIPKGEAFVLEAMWTPERLLVSIAGAGVLNEDEAATPAVFPPHVLRQWARSNSYLPKVDYASDVEIFEAVVDQLQHLAANIVDLNATNGFWNIHYSGNKILSRKPKKEPDIQPQIRLLLDRLEITRGLQVFPEHPVGSGKLDFLITGQTTSGKIVKVCVEFKLAHASDLAHGLEVQLPEYMARLATDFGVYCVVDFGPDYPHNAKCFNLTGFEKDIELALALSLAVSSRRHLKAVVLDVSRKTAPSRL